MFYYNQLLKTMIPINFE